MAGAEPASPGLGYFSDVFPAVFERHGGGCAHAAAPTLELTGLSTRPWTGRSLSVDIGNVTAPGAVLSMGFTDQAFLGSALPLSLAPVGMPQCALNVAATASVVAPVVNGEATVTIPVPNSNVFVRANFFLQDFAAVPGANPLGVLASDSAHGIVGSSQ